MNLREIAHSLGGEVSGGQVLSPGPGHGPRDRSLAIRISASSPDGFLVHSHAGDDFRVCRDYVAARIGLEPHARGKSATGLRSPAQTTRATPAQKSVDPMIQRILREAVPVAGTPGERFLAEIRGIHIATIKDVLGRVDAIAWHPAMLFREEGHELDGSRLGCLVGIMTNAITGEPTGAISRTFVTSDLRKIGKAKTLGAPMGVVRLSLDEDVTGGLHLAEGLETALAGMSIGLKPMWSTGSTAILAKFLILPGIESLTVVADHDRNGAGEAAADEVAVRWREAGREVRVLVPKSLGDLNDTLRGGAAA